MRKGEIPQFSEKWWKAARPAVMFTDPGLDKKLKDFEVAEDRFDYDKMLNALAEIRGMAKICMDKCKPAIHAETIEALKKYPNLIVQKENDVRKKQAEYKQRMAQKAAQQAPPQQFGSPVVIWKRDIAAEVRKQYAAKWLDFKGAVVQLKLDDKILDVLEEEGDYATPAYMVDDANDLCKKTVDEIVRKARSAEPAMAKGKKGEEVAAEMAKEVKTLVTDLGTQVAKIPQARWDKFVAQKKQYEDYKIKCAYDITVGTLSVLGGAVAIAGAVPTGGASLALAIVSAARTSAKAFRTGVNLWREAETVQNGLGADIEKLKHAYHDAVEKAQKIYGVREIGGSMLKGILSTEQPFFATVAKCQDGYKLWDNKVSHLAVNNREAAKNALDLLKQVGELEKKMAAAKSPEAGKILDAVRKLRAQVNEGLENASTLGARISSAEKAMPPLKEALADLAKAVPEKVETFTKWFPTIANLALSGANAGVGLKIAKDAADRWNAALGLADDILKEVYEKTND
jgi:hypothetical protein